MKWRYMNTSHFCDLEALLFFSRFEGSYVGDQPSRLSKSRFDSPIADEGVASSSEDAQNLASLRRFENSVDIAVDMALPLSVVFDLGP